MRDAKRTTWIVLIGCLFCFPVYGYNWAENSGNGTPEDPYQISTSEQLLAIGSDSVLLSRHFILTADIDLVGRVFQTALIAPDIDILEPEYQGNPFTGTFDGRGFCVYNLTLESDQTGLDCLGLFGVLDDSAVVCNVELLAVQINAPVSFYAGGLAGRVSSATIIQCSVRGHIIAAGLVGGLLGDVEQTTIQNCSFSGSLSSGDYPSSYMGGLIGRAYTVTVEGCWVSAAITLGDGYVQAGGLIGGISSSAILCSYVNVVMSCGADTAQIGGLVGAFDFSFINNCYSMGAIDASAASESIGGLVGHCDSILFEIKHCYSVCRVTGGSGVNVGGFIGFCFPMLVNQCYFLQASEGGGPDNGLGVSQTAAQLKQMATYEGWDFVGETLYGTSDYWRMCVNGLIYPRLSWQYAQRGDFACPDGNNIGDLIALSYSWLSSKQDGINYRLSVDADCSGRIDLADFSIMGIHWLSY
ncbi:MAG: hypothetical protein JXB18_02725 [Sedimentisphaerales bacterium]|nr:hypothetical protein [Sedimentisphaerales bacterium]